MPVRPTAAARLTTPSISLSPTLLQLFLRSGALSHLEEERDLRLRDRIVRLQSVCRGRLARQRFQRLKVSDIGNVRKIEELSYSDYT